MSLGDAADMRTPVGHGFLRAYEGVVDLGAVVVYNADAGKGVGIIRWRAADADHFAVEGDVFTYFRTVDGVS